MSVRRLAVLTSFSGQGGVEKMIVNLLSAMAERGQPVDLLAVRAGDIPRGRLPDTVRLVDLGVRHTGTALIPLVRYLKGQDPAALLCAKDRAIRIGVMARLISGARCRLLGRLGTNLSAALQSRGPAERWLRQFPMRRLYPLADGVVAVSEGVAEDTARTTGIPRERIGVIRNPVISARLHRLADAVVDHPWFAPGQPPVVLGAGRVTRQKGFPVLLRAFARVRRERNCRLLILGEGRERGPLLTLAAELGIGDDVDLPGFVVNPYGFMKRAAVFVLSSAWEGSPNVLTEALALGRPVVSTDCPSGPSELLAAGRFGSLVAVGDDEAMGAAISGILDGRVSFDDPVVAVRDYHADVSARRYLEALGLA